MHASLGYSYVTVTDGAVDRLQSQTHLRYLLGVVSCVRERGITYAQAQDSFDWCWTTKPTVRLRNAHTLGGICVLQILHCYVPMSWNGRIPGTPLVVDNFSRASQHQPAQGGQLSATATTTSASPVAPAAAAGARLSDGPNESFFFCTHAHTDHTVGLSSTWNLGTIYCSPLTRSLLLHQFGTGLERRIVALEVDQEHTIMLQRAETCGRSVDHEPDVFVAPGQPAAAAASSRKRPRDSDGGWIPPMRNESFTVALYPTNHCPGSVMFIFTSSQWGTLLHTGDFRYDPTKYHHAGLHSLIGKIDCMYFDATFLATECKFPKKYEAIRETVKAIKALQAKHAREYLQPTVSNAHGSSVSTPSCPPALEWRAYICCEGLGSEELLSSVSAEFDEPFYVGDSKAMKSRSTQLQVLSRHTGDDSRIVTDPAWKDRCHLHLAPMQGFQRFAQTTRMERAEAKQKWRVEQELARPQLHSSSMHSYSRLGTSTTSAPATSRFDSSQHTSPPHTLFIKPSTQWFVHRTRTQASAAASLQISSIVLPLGSSFLARGVRRSRAEEDIASFSAAVDTSPSTMSIREDDRFGVTHILYSMHSDCEETIQFIKFMRPRAVVPINVPCWLSNEQTEQRAYYSQGSGTAAGGMDLPLNNKSHEVMNYVEHILRQYLPVEEVPLVKSVDYVPTPRQNALAQTHRDHLLFQVRKMQEWDARRLFDKEMEQMDDEGLKDQTATVAVDSSVQPVNRDRDGEGKAFVTQGEKRLKLALPPSPLDGLGQGRLHSRWTWHPCDTRVQHLPQRGNPGLMVPFNPRHMAGVHVYLERDIRSGVKDVLSRRLARLGCNVSEWKAPVNPTVSGNSHSMNSLHSSNPVSATAAAPSATVPASPMSCNGTIPLDTTFIFLALHRSSSRKLLLPLVIKQVIQMIGSHSRDWSQKPVFICGTDCLLWLEMMNGIFATEEDDGLSDPSSPLILRNRLNTYITWQDICVWNSLSKFESLRREPQSTRTRDQPTTKSAAPVVPLREVEIAPKPASVEIISSRQVMVID